MPCKNIMYRKVNGKYVKCPCGQCLSCKIARMNEWKLRLLMEKEYHDDSAFITLTYDEEHLSHLPDSKEQYYDKELGRFVFRKSIYYKDLTDFNKRFRKNFPPKSIKFYACGEYGENKFRPHFHSIVFGAGVNAFTRDCLKSDWGMSDSYRFDGVNAGLAYAEADSMLYTVGYVRKKFVGKLAKEVYEDKGLAQPDSRCSQGLGLQWWLDNQEKCLRDGFIKYQGREYPIPRYFIKNDENIKEVFKKRAQEWRVEVLRKKGWSMRDIIEFKYSGLDNLILFDSEEQCQSAETYNQNLEDRLKLFQRSNTLIQEL